MVSISNFFLIYVTVKNQKEAEKLASLAIKNNFAACGNIFPKVKSIYKWKDKIQKDNETILILKTNSKKYDLLEKIILENHSYDVPCTLKIPINSGHKEFLKWIDNSLI